MNHYDCDVIIVGGGPVGLGLAIELGQRGLSAIVIERLVDLQPIPKGQNLTQRTLEHFHFWGVEDAIRAAAPLAPEQGIGGLTAYRTLLSDYHYDWYQRELVRPYYFTDNERVPQYDTERILRERVAALAGVAVNYGWSAERMRRANKACRWTLPSAVVPAGARCVDGMSSAVTAAVRWSASRPASPRRCPTTTN